MQKKYCYLNFTANETYHQKITQHQIFFSFVQTILDFQFRSFEE